MKRLSVLLFAACTSGGYHPAPPQAHHGASLRGISLAAVDGATAICPGVPFQVIVSGTTTDGRQLATPTSFHGGLPWVEDHGLPWDRFELSASVGSLTPSALYVPPSSIVALAETRTIGIQAIDRANPRNIADAQVPVDFDCAQSLAVHGALGAPGKPGGVGGQVEIRIGHLATRAHGDIVLVSVDSALGRNNYLLEPGAGTLAVDLTGGVGGSGAAGGPGGSAVIRVDASDRLLAEAVTIHNPGGEGIVKGRAGAAPQITFEDPSTLFADELAEGVPIALPRVANRK
ncbi:MAG: hypothetical protein JO257_32060 [Deltaproteobacteria bacterium]|nr:hypothetical protein [Deltaproteobacteria bacterium]